MGLFLTFLIAGIIWHSDFAEPDLWPMAGIAAAGAFLVLALGNQGLSRPRIALALWGVLAAWIAVGLNKPDEISDSSPWIQQKVTWQGVMADREDRADSIRLLVDQVEAVDHPWTIPGMVQMSLSRQQTELLPGDRIRFTARLHPPVGSRNPGGWNYGAWLRWQGVAAVATSPVLEPAPHESIADWRWNRLREKISLHIAHNLPIEERGLAEALLVGKMGWLDLTAREALQTTGIYHLVSISGLHLGLVAGWSFWSVRLLLTLCFPLSRRVDVKRLAAVAAFPPVLAYAALAGWSVAPIRSAIMVGLYLLAVLLGRDRHSWRALGLAAILLLLWQPQQLFEAGFIFSFLAVAVLFWVMPPLSRWHADRLAQIKGIAQAFPLRYRLEQVNFLFLEMLFSSAAIEVALAPCNTFFFHRLTPYGILVNLIAIPWTSLTSIPIGLAALLIWPFSDDLSISLLHGMGMSLAPLQAVVNEVSQWSGAWWRHPGPTLPGLTLFLAAAAGVATSTIRWRKGLFLLVALAGLFWPRSLPPPGWLQLTLLDVGQAQSLAFRSPTGHWSLLDAGGMVTPRFNIGEGVISDYLWRQGATELDRLLISHPQVDHMGGAERILRNFPVKSLWLAPTGADEEKSTAMGRLLHTAKQLGVPVRRLTAGIEEEEEENRLWWRILHPPDDSARWKGNNRSLVVELRYGHHRFLVPADLEKMGEKQLVLDGQVKPVTLLVAPHHGSKSSSSPAFVSASHPSYVAFSVGAYNRYGFPKEEVVERWRQEGAQIWRTDQHGAVVIRSDGQQIQIRPTARHENWEMGE